MERESAILKHKTVVQPFIKDAFKEGAHRIKPRHIPQDQWARQIMIGVVYNDSGSTATHEELAKKYGSFRQSISESNKFFLRNLWNNSSSELQGKYPLNDILTARKSRKPWSQESRERSSLSQGGASLKIKQQVESGITDINEISKNTGLSKRVIATSARFVLREWGVVVFTRQHAPHREDLEQLGKETDDKKTQDLLDRIPCHVILNLKRKREASQFLSLSSLIREAGFRTRYNHPFATSLKNAGIPISTKEKVVGGARPQTQIYYILLSRHKDRAIQALKQDQGLQRFQR